MMKRILVAEDEPAIREGLVDLLESEGYAVTSACDGDAAIAAFQQHGRDAQAGQRASQREPADAAAYDHHRMAQHGAGFQLGGLDKWVFRQWVPCALGEFVAVGKGHSAVRGGAREGLCHGDVCSRLNL